MHRQATDFHRIIWLVSDDVQPADHGSRQVVEVMADTASELTNGLHLLCLKQHGIALLSRVMSD
jgi:hypothetical protein